MFQSIQDLINAVSTNTGTDTAVSAVRQAFDFVTSQRVFYGNGMNQIQSRRLSGNTEDAAKQPGKCHCRSRHRCRSQPGGEYRKCPQCDACRYRPGLAKYFV